MSNQKYQTNYSYQLKLPHELGTHSFEQTLDNTVELQALWGEDVGEQRSALRTYISNFLDKKRLYPEFKEFYETIETSFEMTRECVNPENRTYLNADTSLSLPNTLQERIEFLQQDASAQVINAIREEVDTWVEEQANASFNRYSETLKACKSSKAIDALKLVHQIKTAPENSLTMLKDGLGELGFKEGDDFTADVDNKIYFHKEKQTGLTQLLTDTATLMKPAPQKSWGEYLNALEDALKKTEMIYVRDGEQFTLLGGEETLSIASSRNRALASDFKKDYPNWQNNITLKDAKAFKADHGDSLSEEQQAQLTALALKNVKKFLNESKQEARYKNIKIEGSSVTIADNMLLLKDYDTLVELANDSVPIHAHVGKDADKNFMPLTQISGPGAPPVPREEWTAFSTIEKDLKKSGLNEADQRSVLKGLTKLEQAKRQGTYQLYVPLKHSGGISDYTYDVNKDGTVDIQIVGPERNVKKALTYSIKNLNTASIRNVEEIKGPNQEQTVQK